MKEEILYILKWTAVIIITGFFAQFGKMFAQFIIRKIKGKTTESNSNPHQSHPTDADSFVAMEKQRIKLEKKRTKAAMKKKKKLE